MKSQSRTIIDMLIRLEKFKQQNIDVLSQFPLFIKTYAKVDKLRKQLLKGMNEIEVKKNHITKQKWEKKENLAGILSIVLGNLAHYNISKGDNIISNHLYSSEKRLVHTQSDNLTLLADKALELCKQLGGTLPEIGISDELFQLLETTLFQYLEILELDAENQNKRNEISLNIDKQALKVLEILDSALDPVLINVLKKGHPLLLNNYFRSRRMPAFAHRKTAIKGRIFNAETNSPLSNIEIDIPRARISCRNKSVQGGFFIRHLHPGQYTIIFKHKEFETVSMEFTHRWGETSYLEVRMPPLIKSKPKRILKDKLSLV